MSNHLSGKSAFRPLNPGDRLPGSDKKRQHQTTLQLMMTPDDSDNVRRAKAPIFSGCNSHPATVVPAGSNRDDRGGNEPVEALDEKGRFRWLREQAGRNASER